MRCSTPLRSYHAVGVRLLGNNAANHTSKLGVEPGLDPPVTARVKVASVEGLDVVDPLVGMVADTILFAFKESVDARIGNQANVVVVNKGKPSHEVVDPYYSIAGQGTYPRNNHKLR